MEELERGGGMILPCGREHDGALQCQDVIAGTRSSSDLAVK